MTPRGIILCLATALILSVAGVFFFNGLSPSSTPEPNPLQAALTVSESFANFPSAVHLVRDIHNRLNNLVCWENDYYYAEPTSMGWVVLPQQLAPIESRIRELMGAGGTPDLHQDLLNVLILLEMGLENRQFEALVYAHRIIHDLDYYVFKSPESQLDPSDYWSVTVTLEGSANKLEGWLNQQPK